LAGNFYTVDYLFGLFLNISGFEFWGLPGEDRSERMYLRNLVTKWTNIGEARGNGGKNSAVYICLVLVF
jgi:hypothetical protein